MKIRKNHAKKRYRYNVNRKTLNKSRFSTGKIKDPMLKKLWEDQKRPCANYFEMGLCADPNKAVPIPNFKQERLQVAKIVNGFVEEELDENELSRLPRQPKRAHVAQQIEALVNERGESEFRLPKGVVTQLGYFLDKYKFNYKAMVMDQRNYDQWTWKQFRMKIRNFMSIPDQFNKYLTSRNMQPDEKLPWPEYDSDSEWR